ncbi:MAG: DUF6505 family protein [Pseudomonadota bacterium]
MKFLCTVRFDHSDDHVFAHAAPADDWAVSGGGAFAGIARDTMVGKLRQAFANGFLGVASGGRATFAQVAHMSETDREAARLALIRLLLDEFGAPDAAVAEQVAGEEMAAVDSLCADVPINTVFTIRRTVTDDGAFKEEYRTIQPPSDGPRHARIWAVVDDDG